MPFRTTYLVREIPTSVTSLETACEWIIPPRALSWRPNHSATGGRLMSYVIAGHHAGLADWDGGNGGVLRERLERRVESWQDAAASWLKNERLPQPNFRVAPTTETCSFKVSLFARMIFSCLVDADFLCTEAFMSPDRAKRRALSPPTLGQLAGSLRGHLKDLSIGGRGSVHDLRQHVLNLCRQAAPQSPGVFYAVCADRWG